MFPCSEVSVSATEYDRGYVWQELLRYLRGRLHAQLLYVMNMDMRMAGEVVAMDEERFIQLWLRCAGDAQTARRVFRVLHDHYSQRWRRYHTGAHVVQCMKHFDLASHLMDNPDAVEMALWFHDVVYDAQASDNEQNSAELFMELSENIFDDAFRRQVYGLIMITEHCDPPGRGDACYMVDIDLSSFGLPWDEFEADSRNVRAEFLHLNEENYNSRQFKFLKRLMDRPSFYNSDFFRTRCERQARANLTRRLKDMVRLGYGEPDSP